VLNRSNPIPMSIQMYEGKVDITIFVVLKLVMRITKDQAQFLKSLIAEKNINAQVFLFGSRVNSEAKGGDIDILILSETKLSFLAKSNIRLNFCKRFGDQKLDLVNFTFNSTDPFKELVMLDAILL